MTSWRDLVPAPLAAPESKALKAARLRTIVGLFLLAELVLFFAPFRAVAGSLALALLAGLATFTLVQGWWWVRAKRSADDAWLMREMGDAP